MLDIIDKQQKTIKRQQTTIDQLSERLTQYEPDVARETSAGTSTSESPSASYSVDAESKRRQRRKRRRKKKSPGRRPTAVKFADAKRVKAIYPRGADRDVCLLVRERAVWRLINNRAVLVGYRIFAGPDGKEPRIPGVTPRCEYGIEILVVLAFLVYVIGISLDKACAVLSFFCQLPLAKSQADALLRQLARHWNDEFDTLCHLMSLARQMTRLPVGNQESFLALVRRAALTSQEASGVIDLLQGASQEQASYVLSKPREALAQARGMPPGLRDPRLSQAGNWLAKQLRHSMESLTRIENWLRTPNQRELHQDDRAIVRPLLARLGDQASVVAELVLGPDCKGECHDRSAAS